MLEPFPDKQRQTDTMQKTILFVALLTMAVSASAANLNEISIVRKYADKGDPEAQFVLGKLYARGIGVEQSDDKSTSWFLEAASQGLPQAQNRIGKLYLDGAGGLPEDPELAYEWFSKAADQGLQGPAVRERILDLLNRVGIRNAEERLTAYPHELSGGQRQRVMIAMALANKPDLLIADEPTTALDVTIQAQILELLAELKKTEDMGLLFITHDLSVVAQIADRIAVMQQGRIVESGSRDEVLYRPRHPYTRQLLDALPSALKRRRPRGSVATAPYRIGQR